MLSKIEWIKLARGIAPNLHFKQQVDWGRTLHENYERSEWDALRFNLNDLTCIGMAAK